MGGNQRIDFSAGWNCSEWWEFWLEWCPSTQGDGPRPGVRGSTEEDQIGALPYPFRKTDTFQKKSALYIYVPRV